MPANRTDRQLRFTEVEAFELPITEAGGREVLDLHRPVQVLTNAHVRIPLRSKE